MFKKLNELGQTKLRNPESIELDQYVDSIDGSEIISTLKDNLLRPEAPQALNYLLLGFSEKSGSQKKRLKVCVAVINAIHACDISTRSSVALSSRIAQELTKFPTPHLVSVAELCVDFIRSSNADSQTCWKELLPKVLAEVESHREVEYAGAEMSGVEFKQRIIQVICSTPWNCGIATSLAAMFIDIQISEEEHQQVVNKLCSYFDKMSPQEIPPLVHQLLILCKNQHGVTVFLSLRHYFNSKIYNKKAVAVEDVDSITSIMESDSKEMGDCESMVLYHVEESAKLSRGCVTDLLKFAKNCINCPELVLDPFMLAILVSLSTIPAYELQVTDTLKAVILRSTQEEERRRDSAWLRQNVPSQTNFEKVLLLLIQSNVCTRDRVLKGLVQLCMSLLNMPSKGKEAAAELLWAHGRHSLVYIVKRHRQVAKTVLQTLTDHIITGQNVTQYTECLVKLCTTAPLVVKDNLPILLRQLEFLGQLPTATARRVITALLAIVRISSKLRDSLILVLRKALFSRELETRKIAVIGFLQLLKLMKVKGLAALSQSEQSYSGPSIFTQICTEVHTQGPSSSSSSNEAICLEVLGVLRRCFVQQASVKICLYEGLYDALCKNPELCLSVLDTLLDHFNQFYQVDPSTLPPLDISKSVTIQGAGILIQEPVGKLVFVMQQVVLKAANEFGEDGQPRSLEKMRAALDSLVTRYAQCDLNHFELDEGTNFLDILPETLQLQEAVRQTIGVYQALMAYTVCAWNAESDAQQGQKLLGLFKAHNLLVDYVKNCKPAKKEGGGKKDKEKNAGLPKIPVFKLPETVWDFASIYRLLTLLLSEDVPWAIDESTTEVRGRRPMFRFALQTALEVINQAKVQMAVCKSSTVLKPATELAKLLYERCLKRFNDLAQFEMSAAVLAVECLYELLSLLFTHFHQISPILAQIVSVESDKELTSQLKPLMKTLQQLLVDLVTREDDQEEMDTQDKQLLQTVVSALTLLMLKLPPEHAYTVKVSLSTEPLQQLLGDLTREDNQEEMDAQDKQLLQTVVSALTLLMFKLPPEHAYTVKVSLSTEPLQQLLGDLTREDNQEEMDAQDKQLLQTVVSALTLLMLKLSPEHAYTVKVSLSTEPLQQLLGDLTREDNQEEMDAQDKQLLQTVVSALTLLMLKLPPEHAYTVKMVDWLTDFAYKRSLPAVPLTKSYLSLLLTMVSRCKTEAPLLDSMAIQLCHLFGSVNDVAVEDTPTSLSILSESTMTAALPLLCTNLASNLSIVEWLVARLRAQLVVAALPAVTASPTSRRESVGRQESSVVHQLGYCVNVMQSLSCVGAPVGPCTEAVFRLLSHCYATLTVLTKYFTTKCSPQLLSYQHARFGKLVKLSGSHLSSQIADLILYVEDLNKDDKEKKVKEAQVLRQARKQSVYIPKLVADLENFSKAVTMLSKKCKDESLSTNMKLTTTRDFRINTKKLQEVMNRNREGGSDEEELETSRVNALAVRDMDTSHLNSSVVKGKENVSQAQPQPSQRDADKTSQPPAKKKKLSKK